MMRAAARRATGSREKRGGKTYVFRPQGRSRHLHAGGQFAIALAHESKRRWHWWISIPSLGPLGTLESVAAFPSSMPSESGPPGCRLPFRLMVEHQTGVSASGCARALRRGRFARPAGGNEKNSPTAGGEIPSRRDRCRTERNAATALLKGVEAIYLISQADVPSLRNVQRLGSFLCDQTGAPRSRCTSS